MRGKASLASRLQCVLLLLVVARTAAASGTIYVDADAPGANNGLSWENAYVFLQDALADANSAEKPVEIRVAQGTYTPDQGFQQTLGNKSAFFQLINEVAIKGGFAGFSELYPNARDIEAYETILSGDLNGDNIDINDPGNLYSVPNRYDNSSHVVKGSNTDQTAVLDGVTITGGYITVIAYRLGGGPSGGAGMFISSGSPTLNNCKFIDNVTGNSGGGLLIYNDSNPTLSNCKFMRNYAGSGGGIFSSTSSPTLINCIFSDNFTTSSGAGMLNFGGNPILTNCTFRRNSIFQGYSDSNTVGGGMYNRNGNPVLTNCTFTENSASFAAGGMYNKDCKTVLNNCEFVMNTAPSYDGAISNNGGQLVAKGCIFRKNYPGAVSDGNSNGPTFTECIFSGNSSLHYGGAACVEMATFNHCIFTGNKSLGDYSSAGAVYGFVTLAFNNCTFSNNWVDSGQAINCDGVTYVNNCIFWEPKDQLSMHEHSIVLMFVDYSDIQGGWTWPGKGIIDADPCFVDPGYWANADDPNVTAEPNDPNAVWFDGDYHLKSQDGRWDPITESWVFDDVTSPCIDTGDPNSPVTFEPFPNGGIINMGAYGGTAEASMSSLTEGDNKGTNSNNNGDN